MRPQIGPARPWIRPLAGGGVQGGRRLLCFNYAGGGTAPFYPLSELLAEEFEVAAVALPGRESRIGEPPQRELAAIVGALADTLEQERGREPPLFFGHSMGAIVAFEVARELRRRGGALPDLLVVSGARAPHLFRRPQAPMRHLLPQREFIEVVTALGGTPSELFDYPELLELVLPALRADFEICDTYCYLPEPPLPLRALVLGGSEDEDVPPESLAAWREHVAGEVETQLFGGGHFFINQQWQSIGDALRRSCRLPVRADG